MISATGEKFHSVALTGGCQDSPNAHAELRNRRVGGPAIELSATELCELVPDIPIVPEFSNARLKWIKPAGTVRSQR